MTVEIPQDTELVEPLDEGCIWRQTRGTATEVLAAENKAESTEKVEFQISFLTSLSFFFFVSSSNPTLMGYLFRT